MRFWSLACLGVIVLELNRWVYRWGFLSYRSGVASIILITGTGSNVMTCRRIALVGVSSACRLSELLTDVNVHIVRTDLGVDGGVHIPSSSMTGTVGMRAW